MDRAGSAPQRVLLTARSACAAWGMREIWRIASRDAGLDVRVVAQEPAATIFRAEGVPFVFLDLPPLHDPKSAESRALINRTRALLQDWTPDVALVGLSVPTEGGIDEAVVLLADFPTFVLQDFWGDCNLFFGRYADCYLTSDEEGARATSERHGVRNLVLGSPRHAKYARRDLAAVRQAEMARLALDPDGCYYGFFCQPLFRFPGYRRTVDNWAQAVRGLGAADVIYRPHPASDPAQVEAITRMFRNAGLEPRLLAGGPIENALLTCSVVTSAMSNSNIDAVYVNHFAPKPIVVPTYMLHQPDVVAYMQDFQDVDRIPAVVQGLARVIRREEDAADVLAGAMGADERELVWQRARAMPDPVEALARTVDILKNPQAYV